MSQDAPPLRTVGQAAADDEFLGRLFRGLPPQLPATLSVLRGLAEPGRPLNRLAACVIMLDYLRVRAN